MGRKDSENINKQNRSFFLNNLKQNKRFRSALNHGFVGAALASVATGATAGVLFATGIITIPLIVAPFLILPLFAPVIAGIAAIIIAGFLTGIAVRYLYTPSKIYTDFYKEFESDKNELFIDKEDLKKKQFKNKNFLYKRLAIRKWESKWLYNDQALKFWKDGNKLKKIYIEQISQAVKYDNKKKFKNLCNLPLINYIKYEKDSFGNNLLHLAVKKGDLKLVQKSLENGADANAINTEGITPLHLAAKNGHVEISKMLLEKVTDVNTDDIFGYTPLHLAARNGHVEIIEMLLEKNADINAKNHKLETPVHEAILNDQKEAAQLLISKKANVNSKDIEGYSLFHNLIYYSNIDAIKILIPNEADINTKDKSGNTPLHYAILCNQPSIVKVLLKHSVDLYAVNKKNNTPLQLATEDNNENIVQLIQEEIKIREKFFKDVRKGDLTNIHEQMTRRANYMLGIKDKNGNSLLHAAAESGQWKAVEYFIARVSDLYSVNNNNKTPLQLALDNNSKGDIDKLAQEEIVVQLIQEEIKKRKKLFESVKDGSFIIKNVSRYKLRIKDEEKNSLLHIASENGKIKLIHDFIHNKANVHAKNQNGNTPLHLAAKKGKKEAIEILIQNGADVNEVNNEKRTPLHLAAENGHEEVIETLINKGAKINATDKDGNTPLHFAAGNGNEDTARSLIIKVSDIYATNHDNKTPLQLAQDNGCENTVKLIEEEIKKRELLFEAAKNGTLAEIENINEYYLRIKDKDGNSLLHVAAGNRQTKTVQFLINKNANINDKNQNEDTPLHVAAENGNEDTTQLLIENGAEVNEANKDKNTPLHLAAGNGHEAVIKILLYEGAKINITDKDKNTPLHLAAGNGHEAAIKILFNEGADVYAANKDGNTPSQLELAKENGHMTLPDLIKETAKKINFINLNLRLQRSLSK